MYFAPFILLIWVDLRLYWIERDQLTYGREFETKMTFYVGFIVGLRFTLSKIDTLVKKSLLKEEAAAILAKNMPKLGSSHPTLTKKQNSSEAEK